MSTTYPQTRVEVAQPASRVTTFVGSIRRLSWGAVFAGIVVTLMMQMALNMLGTSIGAATINPLTEPYPIEEGFGTGAIIWMAASALLSLFVGGWVAGRLSGTFDPVEAVLHGLVTWGVIVLFGMWLLTTTIGGLVSGVANAVGQGAALVGQGAAAIAPEVADFVDEQGITLQSIREELGTAFGNTTSTVPATTTDGSTDTTGTTTDTTSQSTMTQPTSAQRRADLLLGRIFRLGTDANPADREEVVNTLVATGMTQQEAADMVAGWEQQYAEITAEVEEATRVAGERVADAVAAIAGVAFAMMVIGAFAAGSGGLLGAPARAEDLGESIRAS